MVLSGHRGRRHQAVAVHGKDGQPEPLPFQKSAGFQHGVVFDRGGDDVVAPLAVPIGHPLDRPIVALRAAAGEYDLRRIGAHE